MEKVRPTLLRGNPDLRRVVARRDDLVPSVVRRFWWRNPSGTTKRFVDHSFESVGAARRAELEAETDPTFIGADPRQFLDLAARTDHGIVDLWTVARWAREDASRDHAALRRDDLDPDRSTEKASEARELHAGHGPPSIPRRLCVVPSVSSSDEAFHHVPRVHLGRREGFCFPPEPRR